MPRHLASLRPTIIVRVAGEVHDGKVNDVVIDGLYAEVPTKHEVFKEVYTTVDLLAGVDTFDANIIKLLENIQAAMGAEPETSLLVSDEVSNG